MVVCFITLHRCCCFFLQTDGKTLCHQKNCDLLYCGAHFIAVVWNQAHRISKSCLYSSGELRFPSFPSHSFLFRLSSSIPFSPLPFALCDTTEVTAFLFVSFFLLLLLPLLIIDSEGIKESNICFTAIS